MSYTSKDIRTLDGIESIRMRPGMFIGTIDEDGLHHLLLEVISNSIDEYLNGHGTKIEIYISPDGKLASVKDDGRGIPFGKTEKGGEAMIELCTNLHSGGKFGQGGYSVSGGLHGIGLTAVNALSTLFTITSVRDDKVAYLTGSKGKDIKFEVKNMTTVNTGTEVSFKPDPEIFGTATFKLEKVEKIVQELSYLTSGLAFYLNGKKFLSQNGLKDMVKSRASDTITDVVYMTGEQEKYKIEVAFQFTNAASERIYAFTNNIPNPEGGTHITGFKTAFTNAMNKLARQYGFIEEKDDNLNGDLMRKGIVAAVSIKMTEAPVFQGQTKEKLMTAEARTVVGQLVAAAFEKAITKKDVKTIVERALIEQKAEEAARRSREAAKKMASGGRNMNTLKDLPSKLVDCTDHINGELWLLEGDSAAGSATTSRDAKLQAVLPLRGKILNTHDKELADIVENQIIKDIITVLGSGIADQFNINNLRYNKIVILADADADGGHINCLILTLFVKHLPDLIKKGRVYMAVPPLFKAKTAKTTQYFYSTEELEKASNKGDVTRFKGIGEMNPQDLWDTTMNPATRKLVQVTTENFEDSLALFEILMGSSAAARRNFIIKNNELTLDEDVYGEDEE